MLWFHWVSPKLSFTVHKNQNFTMQLLPNATLVEICILLSETQKGIYPNLRIEEAEKNHPRFTICPGIISLMPNPLLSATCASSLSQSYWGLQSWIPQAPLCPPTSCLSTKQFSNVLNSNIFRRNTDSPDRSDPHHSLMPLPGSLQDPTTTTIFLCKYFP